MDCKLVWRTGEGVAMGRARVDGAPVTLEAPLRFSVDPDALRVLVPESPPEDGPTPAVEAGWRAAQTLRRWLGPTPNYPVP